MDHTHTNTHNFTRLPVPREWAPSFVDSPNIVFVNVDGGGCVSKNDISDVANFIRIYKQAMKKRDITLYCTIAELTFIECWFSPMCPI